MRTNYWRRIPAIAATLLVSVPSALGVQRYLEPIRDSGAAWSAAAGFELIYLSTALLVLQGDLRRYAQRVAMFAVAAAVFFNTLADYQKKLPGSLTSGARFTETFDLFVLFLSFLESLPLAGLAFAMATLLHRLSEDAPVQTAPFSWREWWRTHTRWLRKEKAEPDVSLARIAEPAVFQEAIIAATEAITACPNCGAVLTTGQYGAARRWGHCAACKEQL